MGQLNTIYLSLRKSKLNKVAVYLYVGQLDPFFLCKRSVRGRSAPHPILEKKGKLASGPLPKPVLFQPHALISTIRATRV